METNPRHLNILSEFFKDSEEGWAHAIAILEYGIRDIQSYRFESSYFMKARNTLVLTFTGCEGYKIKVIKVDSKFQLEIYPHIAFSFEYQYIFEVRHPGSSEHIMSGIAKLVDMARAGRLH